MGRSSRRVGVSVVLGVVVALAACQESPPAGDTGAALGDRSGQRNDLLLAAASVGLPPEGIAPGDLPEPQSPGAKLVAKYCAQCHELPTPTAHSATDWPGVIRRMWLRMDAISERFHVQAPTLAERATMVAYVTRHALEVSGANLPAGPGREVFAEVCSKCHALPDPRVHSAQDWVAVFERMERNMERMKLKPLARAQTTDILLYLQDVASRR